MSPASDEVASAASNYEVLARLATGGMAEIYLARAANPTGLARYVVLKRILREKAGDTTFVEMFLDEARLAAQLQHPNVAQVYDIGRLGDSYFFTMEYVHGETLRAMLRRAVAMGQPVPIGCALAIGSGVAAGLHHAHTRHGIDGVPLGIVHRDVSPSNIMSSFEGVVKLVDFGVAKATHRSAETLSGTVKGKISYLSPEQCRGNDVDRRSDLFSLGIVLWETIAGARLYRRNSDFDAMQAIVSDEPPRLATVRSDVPPALDALVQKLLAKSPAARYQSGEELHEHLHEIAVRSGVSMSPGHLGRFLRDLFGPRPEPWVALAAPDAGALESVPLDAPSPVENDPVEQALAHVIDLGALGASPTPDPDGPFAGTAPRTVADPPKLPYSTVKLGPARASGQVTTPDGPLPVARARSFGVVGVATPPFAVAPETVVAPPPELATPPDVAASGSYTPPRAASAGAGLGPAARAAMRPLVIAASAIALVVAGAVALIAMHRSPPKPKLIAIPEPIKEPAPVAVTAPPAPAIPPDAAVELAPPVPPVAASPSDHHARASTAATAAAFARAFQNGRYADAVAICRADAKLVASIADQCVLAACKAHDARHARRWLPSGPSRAELTNECRVEGTVLDAHPTNGSADCAADPFACQE